MTEGVYQNLGPKTFIVFILKRSLIPFVFIILIILIFIIKNMAVSIGPFELETFFNTATLIGFICLGLSIPLAYLIAHLEYTRFKVMIGIDTFNITKGVLTKEEISLPYRRIESVDIKQPFMYQILGVSRLTIETVIDREEEGDKKMDDSDEVLPAIDKKLALEIQAELTRRANIQKFSR